MHYCPRKRKLPPLTRARQRNISVHMVWRKDPDLKKLVRAFMAFAEEQRSAGTALGVPEVDTSLPQALVDRGGRDTEALGNASQRPA